MAMLTNLKLRTKLFLAVLPLAVMVVVATVYSSIESQISDSNYTLLVDSGTGTLKGLTAARGLTMRFGMVLYQLIAEPNPDRRQSIDGELDKTYADYRASIAEATQLDPDRAAEINQVAALFDKAASDARPVRAAALNNSSERAMSLMHASVAAELEQARQAAMDLIDREQRSVDRQNDDLTVKTHRSILTTWLVLAFGLAASLVITFYIIQSSVVTQLMSIRASIQELAGGQLDQPIHYLEQANEIGEICRALSKLRAVAREHENQLWVKARVSGIVQQLQSAPDFTGFGNTLLSRVSESIPLLYGALYVADESRAHFTRVGAFANVNSGNPKEFALGEGMVGQAAVERRPLTVSADDQVKISAGMISVTPGNILFVPRIN
jgi:hypothetical protein